MAGIKKIVLAGYYGYQNAGDELILKNILAGFKKYLPDIKIVVLTRHPEYVRGSASYIYINRYNPLSIISSFIYSDALIMGGGSLLQDISGFFSIYYYFTLMVIAKLLGKKLIIFNQGIGPIRNKFNKIIAKIIFLNTDLIIVRDKYSKKFVEKITKNRKKVILGADPVFNITPAEREKNKKKPFKIGFSIRNWKNLPVEKKFLEIKNRLIKDGWVCYNLPFHYPVDNLSSSDIKWKKPEQLFSIVCKLDAIIGMRLHSLMLGAIHNLPMIGISYNPKVKHFCRFMGIPFFEASGMNTDEIVTKLKEIYKINTDYSEKLKLLNERLKSSWKTLNEVLL